MGIDVSPYVTPHGGSAPGYVPTAGIQIVMRDAIYRPNLNVMKSSSSESSLSVTDGLDVRPKRIDKDPRQG